MPGWSQRPLFKNPTNMMGGGPVGMPAGYVSGGEVKGYEQAIEDTAKLFASSDPKNRDYMENIHWYSKNLAGGHRVPKEQVMQDLMKAIEAQRGAMPVKKGIMERLQEKMGGSTQKLNQLGGPEDINFSPTGMVHGGIVELQTGGIMPTPELFEGEEIVETNPMLNQMAGQGGSGIMSASAEPAPGAAPERNVPNERGIIELAMDTEEVEDDEPMIAFAKQEAQSRLDEEFNILKSTAQAEAATGNPPSAVIKSSMDDLARSARRIENETVEKYPEVPANTNLISSDDLIPYREELVTIFEPPEVGSEEPLMDTAILAKRGGLIPRYQEGGVAEVAPGWDWIDKEFRGKELTLEEAEEKMYEKYGPAIGEVRKKYGSPETELEQRKRRRGMTETEVLAEIAKEKADPRKAELLKTMEDEDFMTGTGTPVFPGTAASRTRILPELERGNVKKYIETLKKYKELDAPLDEKKKVATEIFSDPASLNNEQSLKKEPLGPPQYKDAPAELSAADKLKKTYGDEIDTLVSGYSKNVAGYDEKADKQDEELLSIFEEMKAAIPERARLAGRRTPYTGGGAQSFLVRRTAGKQIEGEMFEGLRVNKLRYYELRKKETEARRAKDYEALTSLTEQKIKILSDIDLSVFDAETARRHALELEQTKYDFALDLELYKFNLDPANLTGDLKGLEEELIKNKGLSGRELQAAVVAIDPVRGSNYYPSLKGTKTFENTAGKTSTLSFPEFARQYLDKPKESFKTFDSSTETKEEWKERVGVYEMIDIIGIWEQQG